MRTTYTLTASDLLHLLVFATLVTALLVSFDPRFLPFLNHLQLLPNCKTKKKSEKFSLKPIQRKREEDRYMRHGHGWSVYIGKEKECALFELRLER